MAILGDTFSSLFGTGGQGSLNSAIQGLQGVQVPSAQSMIVQLQQMVSAGQLSPQDAQTYLQQQSAMNNIQVSPQDMATAQQSLQQLGQIASQGGMTPQMKAQLYQTQQATNQEAQAGTNAILQNAAARGINGTDIGARALMEQNAANRNYGGAVQAASDAATRQMQASQAAGQLGTSINQQQFGQQAQVANANDVINQFNTQAKQNVENANVAARNQAQAYNLQNAQNLSNTNVAAQNQNAVRSADLQQQQYQDTLAKQQAIAGVQGQQAQLQQQQLGSEAGFWGGLAGAGGTALSSAMKPAPVTNYYGY